MNIKYHHWVYDPAMKELLTRGLKEPSDHKDAERPWYALEPTGLVLDVLKELGETKFKEVRHVTVAEHMDTDVFALSIVHERDRYNRKLGNTIARGRLVKELQKRGIT